MAKKQKRVGNNTPASSFDLFDKSSAAVKRNLKVFIVLYIPGLISALSSYQNKPEDQSGFAMISDNVSGLPVSAIVALGAATALLVAIFMIAGILYQTALFGLELESSKGKIATYAQLWQIAKKYSLRLLGLGIVAGIYITLGLILFIVPGLILIRRYFLAPYALVDKDMGIMEAMRYSTEISKAYSGYIWGVIGVTILIAMTNVVPIFGALIALVLGVLYSVAPALRYQELKKLHG